MGVTLKRGRMFNDLDTPDGKLVAVVNDTAARRYWPGEDPIGKRFAIGSRERFGSFRQVRNGEIEWREIVGVVADARTSGFAVPVQPEVFYYYKQFPLYETAVFVRTAHKDPLQLAPAVRRALAAMPKRAATIEFSTAEQVALDAIADRRQRAGLVSLFSAVAVGLGMLGIYGVLSYTVMRRRQEIGVRMALGAREQQVSRMVVGQALRWTVAGLVLGLAGAAVAGRWIATLLYGVEPLDPVTFAAASALLLLAALGASYAPARRAARVDPAVALRNE
jgi:putative ABC transport system permease protein